MLNCEVLSLTISLLIHPPPCLTPTCAFLLSAFFLLMSVFLFLFHTFSLCLSLFQSMTRSFTVHSSIDWPEQYIQITQGQSVAFFKPITGLIVEAMMGNFLLSRAICWDNKPKAYSKAGNKQHHSWEDLTHSCTTELSGLNFDCTTNKFIHWELVLK